MHPHILNLADVDIREPDRRGLRGEAAERYDLRRGAIAERIGARKLGYRLIVVAPGRRSCPFHNHHAEEEMFLILEGKGELRYGPDRHSLRAGDVIACPAGGPETAHQIINTGEAELRYLAVSTKAPVEICEYPDSGKFLAGADDAATGEERFSRIARDTDGVGYWEGE